MPWQGASEGINEVAKAIIGRLIENVLEVSRVNEHVGRQKILLGHNLCNVVSAYAPQAARDDSENKRFLEHARRY